MGFPSGAVLLVPLAACALAATIDIGGTGPIAKLEDVQAFDDEEGEMCEGEQYGVSCCCGGADTCLEPKYDEVIEAQAGVWTVVSKKTVPYGPPHDRMVVFRMPPGAGGNENASLVLVNAVELRNSTLRGLRALEAQPNGGQVRYIVATSSDNDVFLSDYVDSFPNVAIHVAGRTVIGVNHTAMNLTDPLAELQPELHVQLISGLREPFPLYRNFSFTEAPKYEFFFYHASTKTLAVGELMWYHSCDWSWMHALMFPGLRKNQVHLWNYLGSTLFADAAASADSLSDMLALDFQMFLSLHGELGSIPDLGTARQMVQVSLESWWGPMPDLWLKIARVVLAVLLLVPCVVSCVSDCPCTRLRRPEQQ